MHNHHGARENSVFWTCTLNIPLPHSYVFPQTQEEDSNFATTKDSELCTNYISSGEDEKGKVIFSSIHCPWILSSDSLIMSLTMCWVADQFFLECNTIFWTNTRTFSYQDVGSRMLIAKSTEWHPQQYKEKPSGWRVLSLALTSATMVCHSSTILKLSSSLLVLFFSIPFFQRWCFSYIVDFLHFPL